MADFAGQLDGIGVDRRGARPQAKQAVLPLARRVQLLRREDALGGRALRPADVRRRRTRRPRSRARPVARAVARSGQRRSTARRARRRDRSPPSPARRPGRRLRRHARTSSGPVTGQHGDYYTNAGQVQAPNYRPLQPYVTLPASRTGLTAHGVVDRRLTSEDHTGVQPGQRAADARPDARTSREPQFTRRGVADEDPDARLARRPRTAAAAAQPRDRAVLHRRRAAARPASSGSGRRSAAASPTRRAPTSRRRRSTDRRVPRPASTVAFTGQFSDRDRERRSGTVAFAQVVYDVDNTGTWKRVPLVQDRRPAPGRAARRSPATHIQYFVEACDAAGNCGYSSNKGHYFDAQPLPTQTGSIDAHAKRHARGRRLVHGRRQRHRYELGRRHHHGQRRRRRVRPDPGRRRSRHRRRRTHAQGPGLRRLEGDDRRRGRHPRRRCPRRGHEGCVGRRASRRRGRRAVVDRRPPVRPRRQRGRNAQRPARGPRRVGRFVFVVERAARRDRAPGPRGRGAAPALAVRGVEARR